MLPELCRRQRLKRSPRPGRRSENERLAVIVSQARELFREGLPRGPSASSCPAIIDNDKQRLCQRRRCFCRMLDDGAANAPITAAATSMRRAVSHQGLLTRVFSRD